MKSLYFEVVDDELIFELSPEVDISSSLEQFLAGDGTEIEYALQGYFAAMHRDPYKEIEEVKEAVIRHLKQGATAITVYID